MPRESCETFQVSAQTWYLRHKNTMAVYLICNEDVGWVRFPLVALLLFLKEFLMDKVQIYYFIMLAISFLSLTVKCGKSKTEAEFYLNSFVLSATALATVPIAGRIFLWW